MDTFGAILAVLLVGEPFGATEGVALALVLLCAAPDFLEVSRRDVREAVLLTTTVEVPAA